MSFLALINAIAQFICCDGSFDLVKRLSETQPFFCGQYTLTKDADGFVYFSVGSQIVLLMRPEFVFEAMTLNLSDTHCLLEIILGVFKRHSPTIKDIHYNPSKHWKRIRNNMSTIF